MTTIGSRRLLLAIALLVGILASLAGLALVERADNRNTRSSALPLALQVDEPLSEGTRACGKTVLEDWFRDGRIDRRYEPGCSAAALNLLPEDSEPDVERRIKAEISRAYLARAKPAPGASAHDPLEPNPSPPTLSAEEALLDDAEEFSKLHDVSREEALRRLDLQLNVIPRFENAVAAGEASHYGGLLIQNQPRYRVVVYFTSGSAADLDRYISDDRLRGLVEIRRVARTYQELKAAQLRTLSLRSIVEFSADIDVPSNVVRLFVPATDDSEAAAKAQALREAAELSGHPLPDWVVIQGVSARPAGSTEASRFKQPRLIERLCGTGAAAPPCGEGVRVGVDYDYILYTHCGIESTIFDGRLWLAQPQLDDGFRSAPPGWGDGLTAGVMRLLTENRAEFRAGSLVARFVPAPPGYTREACD